MTAPTHASDLYPAPCSACSEGRVYSCHRDPGCSTQRRLVNDTWEAAERATEARVVEWLRAQPSNLHHLSMASGIERGEHGR